MKNRKTRIAIIVEVKKREMPFMSILQAALKQKGYEVKLIPFRSMCTWRLLFFRPDIVLVNGLRTEDPYFIKQVYIPKKCFKARIACYYSEQVGYYNQSIADGYNNPLILENVDFHVAWGPRFTKDLLEMGVPRERLWYIGSVQYDIDKYLRKTPNDIKKGLSKKYHIPYEKKWVVYADNIIEKYQKEGLYAIRRRDTYEMVERVAKINPDCHIVFRHHPDTPVTEIEDAKKRFARIDNVSVISEGHIFDWTCSISALIMWISTSSLQAMFMDKPVFGFMTSDGKNLEKYWYKDIFQTYNNAEELAGAVHGVLNGVEGAVDKDIEKNRIKYVADWYFKKDGYAFERLCQVFNMAGELPYRALPQDLHYGYLKIINILYYELRAWLGDIVKNRSKERNIIGKDVKLELQKFDISRFEMNKKFEVKSSESGNYLV